MVTPFSRQTDRIEGGVSGVSAYLTQALVQTGQVRVSLVVPKSLPLDLEQETFAGCPVYRLARRGQWAGLPGTLYDVMAGKRQVFAQLDRLKPDLVHFQGCAFLAAGCRRPHVLTIHGLAERDALWSGSMVSRPLRWAMHRWTEGLGRRRVRHQILISDYVRRILLRRTGQKLRMIENPVAESFFEVVAVPHADRILCCARIIERKNILGLIEAFALLRRKVSTATLRLAGEFSDADVYYQRCCALIERYTLQGAVTWLGPLRVQAIQDEMASAGCLVLPSFQETAPLVIEEAMAVGLPVVASNLCGIPELVRDNVTGKLVDPRDPRAIANALQEICTNNALAGRMHEQARTEAVERFKASVVAEKTLNVYQQTLAPHTSHLTPRISHLVSRISHLKP